MTAQDAEGNLQRGPYRVIATREIYRNPWIVVREDSVVRPDGRDGIFGIVEMLPGSTVLALTQTFEAYVVSEFKYGIDRHSIELISGGMDDNESPLAAAQRELREEIGLVASEWVDLGVVDPFTTVVRSPNHLFLATGVYSVGEATPDPGEVLEITTLPFAELVERVMQSEVTHSASCVLVLKAEHYLRSHGRL
jgi:8-oxo-dGTP pyrophosphatase MutT (NUDIX family)